MTQIDKELLARVSAKEVELEHLKTVIIGLNQRLTSKNDIANDLKLTKVSLEKSEKGNSELHTLFQVLSDKSNVEEQKNSQFQVMVIKENKTVLTDKENVENQLRNANTDKQELQGQLRTKTRQNQELEIKVKELQSQLKGYAQCKDDLVSTQTLRTQLQQEWEDSMQRQRRIHEVQCQDLSSQLEEERGNKHRLQEQVSQLQNKLDKANDHIKSLEFNTSDATHKIFNLQDKVKILDDVKRQRNEMEEQLKEANSVREEITREVEKIMGQYE